MKILIIDDDLLNCDTIKDILESLGYYVEYESQSSKVIEKITKKQFNFILLDYKMSGLNGIELFQKIKKINPKIYVILMTSYPSKDLEKKAHQLGIYGVISKPIDIERLLFIIKKFNHGISICFTNDDSKIISNIKYNVNFDNNKIEFAQNFNKTLYLVEEKQIDLLCIDVNILGLNPIKKLEMIKNLNKSIVIIITYNQMDEIADIFKKVLKKYLCLKEWLSALSARFLV